MTDAELAQAIKEVVALEVKAATENLATTNSVRQLIEELKEFNTAVDEGFDAIEKDLLDINSKFVEEAIKEVVAIEVKAATENLATTNSVRQLIEELKEYNTNVDEWVDATEKNINDINNKFVEEEIKTLELITHHSETNSEAVSVIANNNTALIKEVDVKTESYIAKEIESIKLTSKVYIQDELLRLNDHINVKLNALKGDKGDIGEKGDTGEKGADGDSLEHRGDYNSEVSYKRLELVIHNGTTFIATKDTSNSPPGEDWRAIATKGAKGAKGSQGEKGERGVKGKDGDMYTPEDIVAIVREAK